MNLNLKIQTIQNKVNYKMEDQNLVYEEARLDVSEKDSKDTVSILGWDCAIQLRLEMVRLKKITKLRNFWIGLRRLL